MEMERFDCSSPALMMRSHNSGAVVLRNNFDANHPIPVTSRNCFTITCSAFDIGTELPS